MTGHLRFICWLLGALDLCPEERSYADEVRGHLDGEFLFVARGTMGSWFEGPVNAGTDPWVRLAIDKLMWALLWEEGEHEVARISSVIGQAIDMLLRGTSMTDDVRSTLTLVQAGIEWTDALEASARV